MATDREKRWQLQEAKNRFSEVVETARRDGPQLVTRRGVDTAVVLSYEQYRKLTAARRPRRTLVDVLLSAPKVRGGLRIERSREGGRDIDLG